NASLLAEIPLRELGRPEVTSPIEQYGYVPENIAQDKRLGLKPTAIISVRYVCFDVDSPQYGTNQKFVAKRFRDGVGDGAFDAVWRDINSCGDLWDRSQDKRRRKNGRFDYAKERLHIQVKRGHGVKIVRWWLDGQTFTIEEFAVYVYLLWVGECCR